MLKLIASSSLALILAACGSSATSSSLAASSTGVAILTSATARAVNGGINPLAIGVQIDGQVRLGNNSCEASGMTAKLVQRREGDAIVVEALVSSPVRDPNRMCTLEFIPVFASVTLTVRTVNASKVLVNNVDALGRIADSDDLMAPTRAVVVSNVVATPVNGGINPEEHALSVAATISASNSCQLSAHPVSFEHKREGSTITLTAVHSPTGLPVFCTAEFRPVTGTIASVVRFDDTVSSVIVKNVGSIGHDLDVTGL